MHTQVHEELLVILMPVSQLWWCAVVTEDAATGEARQRHTESHSTWLKLRDCSGGPRLRLQASTAGGTGSILDEELRSHMLQSVAKRKGDKIHIYKTTTLKCTSQWFFSAFTRLSNHHHHLCPAYFYCPSKKPHTLKQSLPIPTFPLSLVATSLPSVSMDSPILDISYKCCHTRYMVFYVRLSSFSTMLSSDSAWCFLVSPSLFRTLLLFNDRIISHCMDRPHVVYLCIIWRPSELFPPFGHYE